MRIYSKISSTLLFPKLNRQHSLRNLSSCCIGHSACPPDPVILSVLYTVQDTSLLSYLYRRFRLEYVDAEKAQLPSRTSWRDLLSTELNFCISKIQSSCMVYPVRLNARSLCAFIKQFKGNCEFIAK